VLRDGKMTAVAQQHSPILVSYVFDTPVILYARAVPTLGLLMIPKTTAYMAATFVAYSSVFRDSSAIG
jgi:hypothetical protein